MSKCGDLKFQHLARFEIDKFNVECHKRTSIINDSFYLIVIS